MTSQTSDPTMPTRGTRSGPPLEEDARRAVHAGRVELAGEDPHGRHRRLEGAACHLAAERNEEEVAGLPDAAADDHDLGIEDVDQVGDAGAEKMGRIVHDLAGERVTGLG